MNWLSFSLVFIAGAVIGQLVLASLLGLAPWQIAFRRKKTGEQP